MKNALSNKAINDIALSVVVPVYREGPGLEGFLHYCCDRLDCELAGDAEVIVVSAETLAEQTHAEQAGSSSRWRSISAPQGRARQMNAGAAVATGRTILFLHADTSMAVDGFRQAAHMPANYLWGFSPLRLSAEAPVYRLIAAMINWRSQASRVATGDQGIFVRRDCFLQHGGYADIPLMEDVALSKTLRRIGAPWVLPLPLTTSSRRWENRGILRTILLMWYLRLAYFLGASPHYLHRCYYPEMPDEPAE